jgi:predicted ATPase
VERSDTHQPLFAKLMGFAKRLNHPPQMPVFVDRGVPSTLQCVGRIEAHRVAQGAARCAESAAFRLQAPRAALMPPEMSAGP